MGTPATIGFAAYFRYCFFGGAPAQLAEGLAAVGGRGPNVEIHLRAWRCVTFGRLGSWDDALEEFRLIRELLDDRRDEPPYFASHAFGTAALIHDAALKANPELVVARALKPRR